MAIVIQNGPWSELQADCQQIRHQVFVIEQQVPIEEEWDGQDDECHHFLLQENGDAIATARLTPTGKIGRMAVLKQARGYGYGAQVMAAIIDYARTQGYSHLQLNAQTHALGFYERLGFNAFGGVFEEAGILHRSMQLSLDQSR